MSRLMVIGGEAAGAQYELGKGPVTIGRGHDTTIRLDDLLISRHHARLFRSEGQWWIEDLASCNRTFVNGEEIVSPHMLQRNDRVEIGGITLVFETELEPIGQSWAGEPAPSIPTGEETHFEDSVEALWFRQHAFDPASLEVLYRIASILMAGTGLTTLSNESLREIRSFFKAEVACLFLTEQTKSPIQPTLVLSDGPSPTISQSAVVYSLQSRRAACVRDTRTELPPSDALNLAGGSNGRSLMCAPLIAGDKAFGAILIDYPRPNYFDHRSLVLFTAIAHLVGNGIYQRQQIERFEALARAGGGDLGDIEALVGSSPAIEELRRRIAAVAEADESVLILGERGSGKHEAARAIHHKSPRASGPLVWFHTLAQSPERITASLFGTDERVAREMDAPHHGKIEAAHGGTLVIEEIGALPLPAQAALLAYLKTLKFTPLGSPHPEFADARLIATASETLESAVTGGRFMMELFAKVAGQTITVPPLRARGEDVVELAIRFARQIAPYSGRREIKLTAQVVRALRAYRWPGNVRELRNVIERAVLRSRYDEIVTSDLPADMIAEIKQSVDTTAGDC